MFPIYGFLCATNGFAQKRHNPKIQWFILWFLKIAMDICPVSDLAEPRYVRGHLSFSAVPLDILGHGNHIMVGLYWKILPEMEDDSGYLHSRKPPFLGILACQISWTAEKALDMVSPCVQKIPTLEISIDQEATSPDNSRCFFGLRV